MSDSNAEWQGDSVAFENWTNELENAPQPTCSIDDPEGCESCSG